jgi:hypothetical protein
MSAKTKKSNGMEQVAKQAVRQSKEWNITVREASMSSMVEMLRWNPPMTAMLEPWFERTRWMHDNWLEMWEQQTNGLIEQTVTMIEQGSQWMETPILSQGTHQTSDKS